MSSPHLAQDTHGAKFGRVTVTVDLDRGDAIITAPQPGPIYAAPRRVRLNSLDEIRGAYEIQAKLARQSPARHPHARDMAAALKFAGAKIKAHQQRKR